ncbi:MAG TPA: 50S ribosomal protein L25 [Nitrospiraceae bacterium]|nr:50S ribosomal protein L25 [Nitrospiraceae bacterium]
MRFDMTGEMREQAGKGVARQLRRQGKIPAVLYGQEECLLLTLDPDGVRKILRSHAAGTALVSLTVTGAKSKTNRTALLRDYQVDPVSGQILHADLFEVSMDQPIRVKVPVSVTGGVPQGVKEGGVLHHNLRQLNIECLPSALPDHIEVDASLLGIAQGIHVRELAHREGIRFLDEGDQMVVSVAAPMSEAKLEALLTSGVAGEEGKEPELLAKGKVEGEAAAAPAAGEAKADTKAAGAPKAEKKEVKEEKKK